MRTRASKQPRLRKTILPKIESIKMENAQCTHHIVIQLSFVKRRQVIAQIISFRFPCNTSAHKLTTFEINSGHRIKTNASY